MHSAGPPPSHMGQKLDLCAVDPDSSGSSELPVHVTLPTTARTTTRQKPPPASPSQSPLTPESHRLPLEEFFGPIPNYIPPIDPEKQESEPRNIFAHEEEPNTAAKYLFYYGFVFPPMWIFGSLMLCTRPAPTDPGPSDNPRSSVPGQGGTRRGSRLVALHVQVAERRWSLRCLYAWVTLVICIVCLVIGLWAGRVGAFANR
ncbi:hypothetical protein OPQ81_008680 [Rhizoctonia solani]|nr:hypothetical protein OPQ81_008680 [Rhizoctonia solani]